MRAASHIIRPHLAAAPHLAPRSQSITPEDAKFVSLNGFFDISWHPAGCCRVFRITRLGNSNLAFAARALATQMSTNLLKNKTKLGH